MQFQLKAKNISRPFNMSRGIPKPEIIDLINPAFTNTIVLFGNSITEWSFEKYNKGFGYRLEQYYSGKAQVLNRGVAGSVMLSDPFGRIWRCSTDLIIEHY